MGGDLSQFLTQTVRAGLLAFVRHVPVGDMGLGAGEEGLEARNFLCRRCFDRADAGEGGFADCHPVVQQDRVVHQKRRHAEAGGVADAEVAFQRRVQRGGVGIARLGDMLNQIMGEAADQPDRQHFCPEGA